jgi:hypothetical protein
MTSFAELASNPVAKRFHILVQLRTESPLALTGDGLSRRRMRHASEPAIELYGEM